MNADVSESTCLMQVKSHQRQNQQGHQQYYRHQEQEEKGGRNRCNYNCSISIILSLSLVALIAYQWLALFHGSGDNYHYAHKSIYDATYFSSFDYIVVGGGPSGIVTAVTLARRLQQETVELKRRNQGQGQGQNENKAGEGRSHNQRMEEFAAPKVLLMESGTLSQSDVLKKLQERKNNQNSKNDENEEAMLKDPLLVFQDPSNDININAFDIPYFWNKLSMKKGRDYLLHHWPINRTFLGRAIGGSGIHNAMINVRALPSDFERWGVGNWTAKNMMPYFNLLESYDVDNVKSTNSSRRGKKGPLNTIQAGTLTLKADPIGEAFIQSSIAAGFTHVLGFNEDDYSHEGDESETVHVSTSRIGAGYYEFNIRNGERDSAASAFLSDGGDIPNNLNVFTGATVQKVLFDTRTEEPRAIGVQYTSSEEKGVFEVRLKQHQRQPKKDHNNNFERPPEVILAAGAVMTPQILSNSGIRDGGSISDNKYVGKNLQDHPVVAVAFEESDALQETIINYLMEDNHTTTMYVKSIKESVNETIIEKSETKFGILGTPGFSAGAFLSSPWSDDGNPDVQLTVFPKAVEPHYSDINGHKKVHQGEKERILMLVTVALLRPEGRYEVELAPPPQFRGNVLVERKKSSEESFEGFHDFSLPSIRYSNTTSSFYLTDLDTKRLSWGVEQVRKIQSVGPLSNKTGKEVFPGSSIEGVELRDFIRNASMTNSHWCGSTRMGTERNNSVVDEFLRVHGVANVRIVDAGVMPLIPNGNTHSTTCVVALRAVDLILE